MPERVAVLGAGSWGLAVSRLLARRGCAVTVWEFLPEDYRRLVETRSRPDKLPGFTLEARVKISDDLAQAVADADVVALAVPAQTLREVARGMRSALPGRALVVSLAKGIETGSLMRMSQILEQETGLSAERVAVLSGPSHAEEVALDMPTTVVAASASEASAIFVQELFSTGSFRVYQSDDVIGVELGGALKNIVAIAAGISDGLRLGDNTKGALLTRGLAEIVRLGVALGARAETFSGLSGIGDLVTTCCSLHSRNRFVGEQIGRGRKLADILGGMKMVAEGVETTRSGYELAARCQVEMPITEEVYHVLFKDRPAEEAAANLMERKLRAEIWT